MNSKVSVIIPVYNIEAYLERCIKSIINQQYSNLEIILVDDGSTDSSPEICDSYAREDTRIKVIHKKNGGLADARNAGLDIVTGDYIAFIDSDDYIHKDMFQVMLKVLKENDLSIVECNYKKTKASLDVSYYENTKDSSDVTIFSKRNAVVNAIMDHKLKNVVTNKLYKKELWEEMRYPKGKIFEDVAMTYKIINQCEHIGKIENAFYYYFQREDSIVNSSFSVNKLDHCTALLEILEFIEKEYPEVAPLCSLQFHLTAMGYLQDAIFNRKQITDSNKVINDLVGDILDSKYRFHYSYEKQCFNSLCEEVLLDDFKEITLKREMVKFKLNVLNRSVLGFYILNKCISNSKKIIARLKGK